MIVCSKEIKDYYPGALKVESVCDGNMLPLHMACSPRNVDDNTTDFLDIEPEREKIITFLIEFYSPAVQRPEPERKASVMHLACEHKPVSFG